MGGSTAEAAELMHKWKKISLYVALPGTVLLSLVNLGIHFTGDHHHYTDEEYVPGKGGVDLPTHVRIRTKPYPWSCPDCNLFHAPCWKKCREQKAASA